MWSNQQLNWLFDDWERAVRRTLSRRFTRRQLATLRTQWRLGQAIKGGALFLLPLLFLSLLLPRGHPILRYSLFFWSTLEASLLITHVLLGLRHEVSFGWAFHHSRPLLLSGFSARRDLKQKGFLAACVAVVALLALTLVS